MAMPSTVESPRKNTSSSASAEPPVTSTASSTASDAPLMVWKVTAPPEDLTAWTSLPSTTNHSAASSRVKTSPSKSVEKARPSHCVVSTVPSSHATHRKCPPSDASLPPCAPADCTATATGTLAAHAVTSALFQVSRSSRKRLPSVARPAAAPPSSATESVYGVVLPGIHVVATRSGFGAASVVEAAIVPARSRRDRPIVEASGGPSAVVRRRTSKLSRQMQGWSGGGRTGPPAG
jgi:hypothetical protein